MIDYYEQLTQEEKEEVTDVIQTLYRQTFLLDASCMCGILLYTASFPHVYQIFFSGEMSGGTVSG